MSSVGQADIPEELRAIEREIDAHHLLNPLTQRPFAEAAWYFLAFCEELMIREIIQEKEGALHEHRAMADKLIVHAKIPLQWLARACPPGGTVPRTFSDELYEAAWKFSELSMEYLSFESAFTYATMGLVSITVTGNRLKTAGPMRSDTQYDAYDRFIDLQKTSDETLADSSFSERIVASVRVRDDWFDYDLNPKIVRIGLEALGPHISSRFGLPKDWKLPRFTIHDFERVATVLWVIAFIHFQARVTAALSGCKGIGFSRALIIMEKSELINRLRRYSGVNDSSLTAILEDLTYGSRGQANPDPALQPIVALNNFQIAISPNIVLNSSMERNLTVLLNRLPEEKKVYSKLSKDRETSSRNKIKSDLSNFELRFWYGQVTPWGASSDIDLAIISDQEKCCLVLELKSFIAPADRSEEIRRGIEQIRKRMQMHSISPAPLEERLGITCDYDLGWAVASDTSIGAAYVQDQEVPVVNTNHLISYLKKDQKLARCLKWLRERRYLPREDVDYQAVEIEATIGKWLLEWYGLRMLKEDL
jgi:hypothetical protein